MNAPQPLESENLQVHVAACSERYDTLFRRIGRIEWILLIVAGKVFLILLAVTGFLLAQWMKGHTP